MIWLRWSWRDLRSRWVQVAAIAVVIAVGTGLFSGLRSMNDWRGLSNDASYATILGMIGGYVMLQWVANVLMPNAFPDLGMQVTFNPASLVTVIALSVIAVAVAPVFTIFRLRKTDIPSTLRVME